MMRKVTLILSGAILLAGIVGCNSDSDKADENKKRDMSTQQPVPPQPPPSGHTPR